MIKWLLIVTIHMTTGFTTEQAVGKPHDTASQCHDAVAEFFFNESPKLLDLPEIKGVDIKCRKTVQ